MRSSAPLAMTHNQASRQQMKRNTPAKKKLKVEKTTITKVSNRGESELRITYATIP